MERGLIPAERAALLSDDEAAQLIFLPGFSTAETISDLSGRGVGMDVVRTAIERINGGVELSSVFGQGTSLRLSLPLSMAVTHVMAVHSAVQQVLLALRPAITVAPPDALLAEVLAQP